MLYTQKTAQHSSKLTHHHTSTILYTQNRCTNTNSIPTHPTHLNLFINSSCSSAVASPVPSRTWMTTSPTSSFDSPGCTTLQKLATPYPCLILSGTRFLRTIFACGSCSGATRITHAASASIAACIASALDSVHSTNRIYFLFNLVFRVNAVKVRCERGRGAEARGGGMRVRGGRKKVREPLLAHGVSAAANWCRRKHRTFWVNHSMCGNSLHQIVKWARASPHKFAWPPALLRAKQSTRTSPPSNEPSDIPGIYNSSD